MVPRGADDAGRVARARAPPRRRTPARPGRRPAAPAPAASSACRAVCAGLARRGGEHARRAVAGQRDQEVEPVDAEVVQDQVLDGVEGRPGDPANGPRRSRHAPRPARRSARPAPRPASRHGAAPSGRSGSRRACTPRSSASRTSRSPSARSVTKGFWLSTCLPASQRRLEDRQAHLGMRRDVDHVDGRIVQQVLPAVGDLRVREELRRPRLGPRQGAVGDRRDRPSPPVR